jgi:hypothetical protein
MGGLGEHGLFRGLRPKSREATARTKELNQRSNVMANRKPKRLPRWPAVIPKRKAARRYFGSLTQEPPRTTFRVQSPVVRALPFPGLPWLLSFQQSSVHSHTLPCTLKRPQGFAAKLSTGTEHLR